MAEEKEVTTGLKAILGDKDQVITIPSDVSKTIKDRWGRQRTPITEDLIGEWVVAKTVYHHVDPEDETSERFGLVTLKRDNKTAVIPLGAITGSLVIEGETLEGEEPYIQGKPVYLQNKISSEAIPYKDLMEDGNIVIPKTINVKGLSLRERMLVSGPIIQSRFYKGYSPWARAVYTETKEYPQIDVFELELQKPETNRHKAIPAGMTKLELVPGVDHKHPAVAHCAVQLCIG